jgi:hypothetical protein
VQGRFNGSCRLFWWSGRRLIILVYKLLGGITLKNEVTQTVQSQQECKSIFNLLLTIFGTLIGNLVIFFTALFILQHKGKVFYTADIVFWGMVAAISLARFLNIKLYGGTTEDGEPVSMAHWRKHTGILLAIVTAAWVIVHLINYLVVNK